MELEGEDLVMKELLGKKDKKTNVYSKPNDDDIDEKPVKIKKVVYAPIEDMELEGEDLVMKELLGKK
jgi:hypothetical protein